MAPTKRIQVIIRELKDQLARAFGLGPESTHGLVEDLRSGNAV